MTRVQRRDLIEVLEHIAYFNEQGMTCSGSLTESINMQWKVKNWKGEIRYLIVEHDDYTTALGIDKKPYEEIKDDYNCTSAERIYGDDEVESDEDLSSAERALLAAKKSPYYELFKIMLEDSGLLKSDYKALIEKAKMDVVKEILSSRAESS